MRPVPSFLLLATTAAALALAPSGAAQMPGPPAQMDRFEPFLGNWVGSGTFAPMPGVEAEWSSRSTVERILGGYFVQEDMVVETGMGAPFVFRTLYSWDAARKQYVYATFSNMEGARTGDMYFTPEGAMVNMASGVEDETVYTEQWTTVINGDSSTTTAWRSENGGPFRKFLEGTMQRGGDGCREIPASAGLVLAPAPDVMAALTDELGTWHFEGRVEPMPGMPMMEISGREEIRAILGGLVHWSDIHGDPMPGAPPNFHGQVYTGWSSRANCLLFVSVDNFGGWTVEKGWLQGTRTVLTGSGVLFGLPYVTRTIIVHEDQDTLHMTSERLASTMPLSTAFTAEFTRVKEL